MHSIRLVTALMLVWFGCGGDDDRIAGFDGGRTTTDGGMTMPGTDGGTTPPGTDGGTTPPGTDGGTTPPGTDGGMSMPGTDGGMSMPGTDGGPCGMCPSGETCDASTGLCRISPVTFAGGTIAALRAIRPSLTFGDLTVTGPLTIPSTERTVTITGDHLVFNGDIGVQFAACDPGNRNGPDLTLRATSQVRVRGVDLHGKTGEAESSTTSCANCTGGNGGTLTIEAADVYVGGTLQTLGGAGSRYSLGSGAYNGCDGGDGGDVILRGSSTIVCDNWRLVLDGSSGGVGIGGGVSGTAGVDGQLVLVGPDIALDEIDGLNAMSYNAQVVPYQTLRILGEVNLADDTSLRTNPGALFLTLTPTAEDYIEDLYRIVVAPRTTVTLTATLEFATHDLDLYLLDGSLTTVRAMSNGTSRPETFTATRISSGTYYLAVTFADDNPSSPPTPVAYTLRLN